MNRWPVPAWLAAAAVLVAAHRAMAEWPVNGVPVCIAPGDQQMQSIAADGNAAVFVAWRDISQAYPRVMVQRLLASGEIAPGWPANGIGAVDLVDRDPSNIHVVPDGTGGCFLAWDEIWYGPSFGINYVRVQRLSAAGARAPGWPADGLVADQRTFSDFGSYPSIIRLVATPDGGCTFAISVSYSGCHDRLCGTGGQIDFTGVDANGVVVSAGSLEPYCSVRLPQAIVRSDGGTGWHSVAYSACTGLSTLRHVISGSEAAISLPQVQWPSDLTLTSSGTFIATANDAQDVFSPTWFHINPDGSAAAGSPAAGVRLPLGPFWQSMVGPQNSTLYCWESIRPTPGLGAIRLEADGTVSPGWNASGQSIAPLVDPQYAHNFDCAPDGRGGAIVAWSDHRNPATGHDLYATHVLANGSLGADISSGPILCDAQGDQIGPQLVPVGPGMAIAVWSDGRNGNYDLYAQLLHLDTPVPVLASLARSEAHSDRVSLEWRLFSSDLQVAIERTRDGESWAEVARTVPGGAGRVEYEDTDVSPGERLGYRLAVRSDGALVRTAPAWVQVPKFALAVRLLPSASSDRLAVDVTLSSASPARLQLVDVTGRQRYGVDLPAAMGTQRIELPLGGVGPTIAWLRLRQGNEGRTVRLVITR